MVHDYLLVGQGIAGTLLAHFLLQEQQKIAIIDADHQESSSMVAAGLVNPITGRRFVKSWHIDTLIPFAKATYLALEKQLDISIFDPKEVAMLFGNIKVENDWLARSADADIQDYIAPKADLDFYRQFLNNVESGVEFTQAARVKLRDLILHYQQLLQQQATYRVTTFDYSQLQILPDHVVYQDIKAKRIIFCEGYQAMNNPYFNYLPFKPAKGEILLVKIPNYPASQKLIKHGIFIIHWQDDLYWVGSSYLPNYEYTHPTEVERKNLETKLQQILQLPYEVVEHQAAIRPTVKDRKPFLGQHPRYPNLYIFNGLGAKGSYLGPYFAHQLVANMEQQIPLDDLVNIDRYQNLYVG